jgi:hypothetical protein
MQPEIITAIQELQVRRRRYIKLATRVSNTAGACVRRALGWTPDHPKADSIVKRSAKIVAAFMAKGEVAEADAEIAALVATDLLVCRQMLVAPGQERDRIELAMKKLARRLPAYAFVKGVGGFGELGFAVVIGEAGDLSRYSHPDKLKKRLGLAPYNGKALSTWRKGGGLKADEWAVLGYAPQRRAEVFAVIEDPLFRHQSFSSGPYHAVYLARRARTAETHPDWTKGHSHNDAKRVMVQKLISDLWSEWRLATAMVPQKATQALPASTELHAA